MSERQINKSWEDTEKQGRGPNIPDDWKRYIMVQATIKESHKPRMLLADEILEQMKTSRDVRDKLPERESIAKLISTARHLPVTDEDKPWSIAASVKYVLSPEATRDLLDIWRASLAMGSPISIRQAKWIVYIRNLFYQGLSTGNTYSDKVNRNLWLIRQSWLYSILERASRIMGEQHFDTTNLDAASFMLNWERATALKLGKISHLSFPQEPLKKIEEYGESLTSPPASIKSVEQAVWHSARSEPLPQMEIMAAGFDDEALPEEDDLVAAYWLTYLSKGPLWNDLPEPPEVRAFYESLRRDRERGGRHFDSGGFLDDSMYSRQFSVRRKLLDWVKTDSIRRRLLHPVRTGSLIEALREAQKADLPGDTTPPFNATLLKTVGYAVTAEELESWLKLHGHELRIIHGGFDNIPADVRERFIHDEQTFDDKKALENADIEQKAEQETRQKQLEQEFIELVQHQGGVSVDKTWKGRDESFWESVRDEWYKKHPRQVVAWDVPVTGRAFRDAYERLIEKQKGGTT